MATWSYDGVVPGRELRVNAGDQVQVNVTNQLPQDTTVHWHGLAIRNNMDRVPDVTQNPIPAGGSFSYSYVVDEPGTYWYHLHVGVQFDRGPYGPLIIEDPHEPLAYDQDWTVVLDDRLDGVDRLTPEEVFAALSKGMPGIGGGSAPPSSAPPSSSTPMPGMTGTNMPGMSGMNMPGMSPAAPSAGPMSGMPMGGAPSSSTGSMPGSSAILMNATSPLLGGDAGDSSPSCSSNCHPWFARRRLWRRPPTWPDTGH